MKNLRLALRLRQRDLRYFQHGSALPISLFILLVLTIIGATALNDSVMEERMSSNFQQGNIAFQSGEAAVNKGYMALAVIGGDQLAQTTRQRYTASLANGTPPNWPVVDSNTALLADPNSSSNSSGNTTINTTLQYVPDLQTSGNFPKGCSLTDTLSNCSALVVEVVATGTVAGTNIQRTIRQGVNKPLPSN